MSDKNRWGGGNKFGEYTPLSEIEQEAISRLVESQNLVIHILGWGKVERPRVIFGDLRIGLKWRMDFDRPVAPTPIHWLDLELRTRSGVLLFKERQSTLYGGRPVSVCAGVYLDMVWDIALTALDPKIVKMIMPNSFGLTSRFQDKDTGELTLYGNQSMSSEQSLALRVLRQKELHNRLDTKRQVQKAEKKAIADGVIIDPTKLT